MKEPDIHLSDIGAFVPFPAALLDEQMPRLTDTAWKLLCVIVRQTLGWQSRNGRKKRDWMTQKQLMKRTGRASAALSAALDVLVRENLVECHNSKGEVLLSPQQRRNERGRIYFSLAPCLLQRPAKTASVKSTCVPPVDVPYERTIRVFSGWAKAGTIAVQRYGNKDHGQTSP